jgi:hypothetical protein
MKRASFVPDGSYLETIKLGETEEFPMLHFGFVENVTKSRHGLPSDDEMSSQA